MDQGAGKYRPAKLTLDNAQPNDADLFEMDDESDIAADQNRFKTERRAHPNHVNQRDSLLSNFRATPTGR